jgi:hypothetical protein
MAGEINVRDELLRTFVPGESCLPLVLRGALASVPANSAIICALLHYCSVINDNVISIGNLCNDRLFPCQTRVPESKRSRR